MLSITKPHTARERGGCQREDNCVGQGSCLLRQVALSHPRSSQVCLDPTQVILMAHPPALVPLLGSFATQRSMARCNLWTWMEAGRPPYPGSSNNLTITSVVCVQAPAPPPFFPLCTCPAHTFLQQNGLGIAPYLLPTCGHRLF